MKSAREKRLNAFEEKRTIDAARVKSDLRRDGGSGPEIVVEDYIIYHSFQTKNQG